MISTDQQEPQHDNMLNHNSFIHITVSSVKITFEISHNGIHAKNGQPQRKSYSLKIYSKREIY